VAVPSVDPISALGTARPIPFDVRSTPGTNVARAAMIPPLNVTVSDPLAPKDAPVGSPLAGEAVMLSVTVNGAARTPIGVVSVQSSSYDVPAAAAATNLFAVGDFDDDLTDDEADEDDEAGEDDEVDEADEADEDDDASLDTTGPPATETDWDGVPLLAISSPAPTRAVSAARNIAAWRLLRRGRITVGSPPGRRWQEKEACSIRG
jgi:hypothetical protein